MSSLNFKRFTRAIFHTPSKSEARHIFRNAVLIGFGCLLAGQIALAVLVVVSFTICAAIAYATGLEC